MDDPSGGLGYTYNESTKTYHVYTAEGLVEWSKAVRGEDGYTADYSISCTLYNCIDMSGQETWTPVGPSNTGYTGTFDGGGHTVSNLALSAVTIGSVKYAGFFGCTSGMVKNLGVSIASITSTTVAGGIAGDNSGSITACYSTGDVTASNYAGGIAGYNLNSGTITACYWSGSATAGVGKDNGNTENVAKVGENDVTWVTAQEKMNSALNAITDNDKKTDYRYTGAGNSADDDDAPTLTKA